MAWLRWAGALVWLWGPALALSCGARTGLPSRGATPPSAAFCERADFPGAARERVEIDLLLDRSSSMADDGKFGDATAAIAQFTGDPVANGLGMGVLLFPRPQRDACTPALYDLPDVPIAPLPGNDPAIVQLLSAPESQPEIGQETPTRPALRSAIGYARGAMIGDPSAEAVVLLVTDGAADACGADDSQLAAAAAEGLSAEPVVRTFAVGLESGYLHQLDVIARAGGTGAPILIGADGAAQALIDAFRDLRADLQSCRYRVPTVLGNPAPSDISVAVLGAGASERALTRVAGPAACSAGAFYVDDPPTKATLCPAACEALRAQERAIVRVTVGCGGTSPAAPSGSCDTFTSLYCVASCGGPLQSPACGDGVWTCPPGTRPLDQCSECPAEPHGCCMPGAKLAAAACIDGNWVCPPGGVRFGAAGCTPPAVCAALLPCPAGSYCAVGDETCGKAQTAGTCRPSPQSCGPAVESGACGCSGAMYSSACAARAAGVDLSSGECGTQPNCGALLCGTGTACVETIASGPNSHACAELPPGCSSCGCANAAALCEPCPPGKHCAGGCIDEFNVPLVTCTQL